MVTVTTGEFVSADGVEEGYALGQVMVKWSRAATDFVENAEWLVRIVEETDRLRLWEKNVDGFRFPDAETFLRQQVLLEFDLTEQQARSVIAAVRSHRTSDAQQVLAQAVAQARAQPLATRKESGAKGGRGKKAFDNIQSFKTQGGTSQTHTLRRLARDRPDLLAEVEAGRLSPNAAAIKAGFRRPMKSVPVDSPRAFIAAGLRVFTLDELRAALASCDNATA